MKFLLSPLWAPISILKLPPEEEKAKRQKTEKKKKEGKL